MDGASLGDSRVAPRDRPVEGEVDLEGTGAISVPAEGPGVPGPHARPGDRQELARGHVEQPYLVLGQVRECVDAAVGDDLSTERGQLGGQRVGDPAGATLGDWPANRVGAGQEEHREGAAQRLLQPEHGVRGAPGEQRAGLRLVEGADKPGGRLQRANPEACEPKGTIRLERDMKRRQHVLDERIPVRQDGTDESPVGRRIRSQ